METCTVETTTTTTTPPAHQPRTPPGRAPRVLTHSAMETWGRCETEYKLAYEALIVPVEYPSALAVGSAVHAGVEALYNDRTLREALDIAEKKVESSAERARRHADAERTSEITTQVGWDKAKTRAMLRAWFARYDAAATVEAAALDLVFIDRELEAIETEAVLEAPLVNPLTDRPSRTFMLSGRLDAVVRHHDPHLRHDPKTGLPGWYVFELKTTGENLDDFIEAMSISAQPAIYQVLAQTYFDGQIGRLLGTVLDVVRKPLIRPKKDEALEAFEQRAIEAYRGEPDRFFRRVVLPVDEGLRRQVLINAWRIADGIRRAERYGYVSKRGPACRGPYGPCRYRAICWHDDRSGFAQKETAHEELASAS
jgi:hypothetical protein